MFEIGIACCLMPSMTYFASKLKQLAAVLTEILLSFDFLLCAQIESNFVEKTLLSRYQSSVSAKALTNFGKLFEFLKLTTNSCDVNLENQNFRSSSANFVHRLQKRER